MQMKYRKTKKLKIRIVWRLRQNLRHAKKDGKQHPPRKIQENSCKIARGVL